MTSKAGILISGLAFVCISCSRNSVPEGETGGTSKELILATVGGERLTAAEFEVELGRRSQGLSGGYATHEQRGRLLDELIRRKAALAKARASGLDRDPKIQTLIENLIATRYLEAEFAKRGQDPPVDEAELGEFYRKHVAQFRVPPSVRAGIITLKVGSKAEADNRAEARARAEAIRARALSVDDAGFARLVQENSEDQSTRYIGGDTGWLREGETASPWPQTVVSAAFALQNPGDLAPLVQTPAGVFIIRLTGRSEATVRPLDQVREAVRFQLQQTKRHQAEEAFFTELKRGLDIRINQEAFRSIPAPNSGVAHAPPALPGG